MRKICLTVLLVALVLVMGGCKTAEEKMWEDAFNATRIGGDENELELLSRALKISFYDEDTKEEIENYLNENDGILVLEYRNGSSLSTVEGFPCLTKSMTETYGSETEVLKLKSDKYSKKTIEYTIRHGSPSPDDDFSDCPFTVEYKAK